MATLQIADVIDVDDVAEDNKSEIVTKKEKKWSIYFRVLIPVFINAVYFI